MRTMDPEHKAAANVIARTQQQHRQMLDEPNKQEGGLVHRGPACHPFERKGGGV